ncbi:hypothetical protein B0H16DRAFT_870426 [Mycena metata]|uniref:Uncharacterized protein n=1 Tax=Mycena metata TaxID=1033252 RepID=A0AAD7DLP0_9AGAR|nr:hypothetical protein B0H16DRAFT_870426 [Mycena metata]
MLPAAIACTPAAASFLPISCSPPFSLPVPGAHPSSTSPPLPPSSFSLCCRPGPHRLRLRLPTLTLPSVGIRCHLRSLGARNRCAHGCGCRCRCRCRALPVCVPGAAPTQTCGWARGPSLPRTRYRTAWIRVAPHRGQCSPHSLSSPPPSCAPHAQTHPRGRAEQLPGAVCTDSRPPDANSVRVRIPLPYVECPCTQIPRGVYSTHAGARAEVAQSRSCATFFCAACIRRAASHLLLPSFPFSVRATACRYLFFEYNLGSQNHNTCGIWILVSARTSSRMKEVLLEACGVLERRGEDGFDSSYEKKWTTLDSGGEENA